MPDKEGTPAYFVYILRCADGSYYVGHSTDVPKRVARHNEGRGANWTATRQPVRLVCQEEVGSEEAAIRRERQLKGWSRDKKQALVAGDTDRLRRLSKCRNT